MTENTSETQPNQVLCPASRDVAVRTFIIGGALIAFGLWCMADQRPYKPLSEDINAWGSWATNFYGAVICPIVGVAAVICGIRSMRRKLIADPQGIGYAGKQQIAWSSATGLDVSKFKDKQILYLLHGQDQRLKLDGYKLRNFKELVAFVEARVPQGAPEQGTETPPDEQTT